MAVKLKRPILIGGLGLAFGAYAWESVAPSVFDTDTLLLWGTVLAGATAWWLGRRKLSSPELTVSPLNDTLTLQQVEQALQSTTATIERFQEAAAVSGLAAEKIDEAIAQFQADLDTLRTNLNRRHLRVAVVGPKATGKTALAQWLNTEWLPNQDALNIGESNAVWTIQVTDAGEGQSSLSWQHAKKKDIAIPSSVIDADLAIVVVTGDLTDSQFQCIKALADHLCQVCVVFAQADRYLPSERSQILHQLRQHMAKIPAYPISVIEAAIAPAPIKVRTHRDDGTVSERHDIPDAIVEALNQHLHRVLIDQRDQLLLSTALCQNHALQKGIQGQLNQLRRDRALPVLDEYQWIAAAAAFANPVPSLDLVATAAITAQMVVDIAAVYGLTFSIDQAKKTAGAIAELMVKLGLVELASQALTPLLKSHVLTYAAGGTLQALSAAYLTHVAGLSLIRYFEEQSANPTSDQPSSLSLDQLKSHIQLVFNQNKRGDFLKALVQKGATRLMPSSAS
jgi:uncharacterized protein (DUF697 family)